MLTLFFTTKRVSTSGSFWPFKEKNITQSVPVYFYFPDKWLNQGHLRSRPPKSSMLLRFLCDSFFTEKTVRVQQRRWRTNLCSTHIYISVKYMVVFPEAARSHRHTNIMPPLRLLLFYFYSFYPSHSCSQWFLNINACFFYRCDETELIVIFTPTWPSVGFHVFIFYFIYIAAEEEEEDVLHKNRRFSTTTHTVSYQSLSLERWHFQVCGKWRI